MYMYMYIYIYIYMYMYMYMLHITYYIMGGREKRLIGSLYI